MAAATQRHPQQKTPATPRRGRHPLLTVVILITLATTARAEATDIRSNAAVAMDASTGRILYAKNQDLRLMPASTTKLITAIVVLENGNLDDTVIVSANAEEAPPTRIGLAEHDRATTESLLNAAVIRSANDASVALAEAVGGSEDGFVKMMNRKVADIGLNNTHFINSNGLPGESQYTTAHDMAQIMREALKYPLLKSILATRMAQVEMDEGNKVEVRNTNRLLWTGGKATIGKTGYTRQAGHCFVGAQELPSGTIIVAVMGAPSRATLWTEAAKLAYFGTRVMNGLQEPVILTTSPDHKPQKVKKVSYKKKASTKGRRKNIL